MRTVYCSCGLLLKAFDDDTLFQRYRAHVDRVHPDASFSDVQISSVIAASAHEDSEAPSGTGADTERPTE
jgi:hypothetical protein